MWFLVEFSNKYMLWWRGVRDLLHILHKNINKNNNKGTVSMFLWYYVFSSGSLGHSQKKQKHYFNKYTDTFLPGHTSRSTDLSVPHTTGSQFSDGRSERAPSWSAQPQQQTNTVFIIVGIRLQQDIHYLNPLFSISNIETYTSSSTRTETISV